MQKSMFKAAANEDDGYSSSSSMSSTGTAVPLGLAQGAAHTSANIWQAYFEQELFLKGNGIIVHHVYVTPPRDLEKDPLFVCHHGAGASGLSFALFAKEVRKLLPSAGVLSVEAREHGSTVSVAKPNDITDFSLPTLSNDLLSMIELTKTKLAWPKLSNLVLVGHSLGGAVVTDLAKTDKLGNSLIGYAVIDVVEGSAMEALINMQAHLSNRPSSFPSVEAAVEWHIRSRTIRNPESAKVSVPSLLLESETEKWTWRTDLAVTQNVWENWFDGMSKKFLTAKAAKLLLLAGTDRLDKELMIGQMQGKFQMQVFPEAGHFVQEDQPERTAELLVDFYRRNDRSSMVLPPKVSDLLKQGKKV